MSSSTEIENLLDGMAERISQGKKLYQRWKQQMGSKMRELAVPNPVLKTFLVTYVLPCIKRFPVHACAHGGEPGWSVERSLRTHLPLKRVFSFDMRDAFGQIDENRIFAFFYERMGAALDKEDERTEALSLLSSLCTVKRITGGRMLPQGSPISAALFNRVLYPLDEGLHAHADQKGMRYSRWIDDFILSCNEICRADRFSDILKQAELEIMIAQNKIFFQHNACYLLGYRIDKGVISKVTKEEGERIRGRYGGS